MSATNTHLRSVFGGRRAGAWDWEGAGPGSSRGSRSLTTNPLEGWRMEVLSEQLARRSRLLPALGLLFVVVLWLVPSAALASVVTSASNGRSAEYHGDPGEANNVLVNETADTITFVELTNGIALTDSDGAGGCEVAGNMGTCPAGNLNNLVILLGDGDDAVNAAGTTTFAIIQGGEGDDVLTSGAGNDSVSGQAGDDVLFGGAGNDGVGGAAGDDEVHGGDGDDGPGPGRQR